MKWAASVSCFVAIMLTVVWATANQCNLYNLGLQGGYQCAVQWLSKEDLGQTIPVTYKISDIVQSILTSLDISSSDWTSAIPQPFQTGTSDPEARLIESLATLEPFLVFMVADLIEGFNFTSAELQQIGVPSELSIKANRITMIREYFDFSCSDKGLKSLVSCLKVWMNDNCEGQDDHQFIHAGLDKVQNAYCEGTSANPQVISETVGKLGMIRDYLQTVGVEKDPSSPNLLKISTNAPNYNSELSQNMSRSFTKRCSFVLAPSALEVLRVVGPNSTLSAGAAAEASLRFYEMYIKCSFNALRDVLPQYRQAIDSFIDSWAYSAMRRYGLKLVYVDVAGARSTTVAYGDPHIVTYNDVEHATCSAQGWQMYLSNRFFTVEGFSSLASNRSDGTFITALRMNFSDGEGEMFAQYVTGHGNIMSQSLVNLSGTDLITIETDGKMVKVNDQNSKAVFTISKYKDSYNIVVRMADSLYDESLGLLATGCLSPVPSSTERPSERCQETCARVLDAYQRTCLFDCHATGDFGVDKISMITENLKKAAQDSDFEVVQQETPDTDDSSAALVSMETLLIVTALFISLVH